MMASSLAAFSAVSSSMNSRAGVRFSRNSRAMRACRMPCAEARPSRVAACSSAAPRTLTNTRAWRRSGLVLTSVTVTNPTRGSLKPSDRAALSTSRIASSTRRILSEPILDLRLVEGRDAPVDPHAMRAALVKPPDYPIDRLVERPQRPAAPRGGQRRSLPGVLVGDLGRSEAVAGAQLRLDGLQLRPLGLQAP